MSDSARYYFDVHGGGYITQDTEGLEVRSVETAWTEAVQTIAEMARDAIPKHPAENQFFAVEVRDDDGPVLTVKVTFEALSHRDERRIDVNVESG